MRPWLQAEEDFARVIGHKGFKNPATFGEHCRKFEACAMRCVWVCAHTVANDMTITVTFYWHTSVLHCTVRTVCVCANCR